MALSLDIDARANAGYLRLRDTPVARTEQFSASVLVDVDSSGSPVGIEILTLTADVDVDGIATRYGLPSRIREQLSAALDRSRR